MAGIRPGRCYKYNTSPAYTRVAKNPGDSYITGIPGSKIVHYDMGDAKRKFDMQLSLVTEMPMILRHNSLEAARVAANKVLEKEVGVANYFFKVRVYPHHVLRENAMATGAGADRVQTGMRLSFGKPSARAARATKKTTVMSIAFNESEERIGQVKKAAKTALKKLPTGLKITIKPLAA
ncbi:MAG: hypothetical protein MSIBF_00360 [Candidatus Altiarchaeales archaeon IMC4]|nr:MAG: hypothetical protein MSIBF_00360 [Candidatus Altiarchaeales archaeon IMC4]